MAHVIAQNVQIVHDAEASVWFVNKSDVEGLSAEVPTSDVLDVTLKDVGLPKAF